MARAVACRVAGTVARGVAGRVAGAVTRRVLVRPDELLGAERGHRQAGRGRAQRGHGRVPGGRRTRAPEPAPAAREGRGAVAAPDRRARRVVAAHPPRVVAGIARVRRVEAPALDGRDVGEEGLEELAVVLAGGLEVGVPGLALDGADEELAEAAGEAIGRRRGLVAELLPDEREVGLVVGRCIAQAREAERAAGVVPSQPSAGEEKVEDHGEDHLERQPEEGEGLEVGELGHLAGLAEGRQPQARRLPVVALPEDVGRGGLGAGEALQLAAGEAEAHEPEAEEQREDDGRPAPQPIAGLGLPLLLRVAKRGQAALGLPRHAGEVAGGEVELHAVAPARGDALLVEPHPERRRVALAAVGDEVALVDPRLGAQARRGRVLEGEHPRPRGGHRREADHERLVVERLVPLDRGPVEDGERRPVRGARDGHEAGGGEVGVVREGVGRFARAPGLAAREHDVPPVPLGRRDRERDPLPSGDHGLAAAEAGCRGLSLEVEAVHRPGGPPARLVRDRGVAVRVERELDLDPVHLALRESGSGAGREKSGGQQEKGTRIHGPSRSRRGDSKPASRPKG